MPTPAHRLRSGELARRAGVSADTLRHYEARGLLAPAARTPSGYREYAPEAVARVELIRRALALGFTLAELVPILALRDKGGAPCRSVRAAAGRKLKAIERKLEELERARQALGAILARWDELLERAPEGTRVGLLEALEGTVEAGAPSPLGAAGLRRGRR
jgi:DNA-binding transcriptional MerR regulator